MQITFRETGIRDAFSHNVHGNEPVRIVTDNTMVEITLTVKDGLKVRESGTNLVAVFNGRDTLGVSAPDTAPESAWVPIEPAPEPATRLSIGPTPTFLAIEAIRKHSADTRDVEPGWDAVLMAVENARTAAYQEAAVEAIILGHFNQTDGQWRLNPGAAAREVIAYLQGAPL